MLKRILLYSSHVVRVVEFITEAPFNDDTIDEIDSWAALKGFRFLNSGSDARVYINADQTVVLKVFVNEYGTSPTDAALGFLTFYKFCQRNPSNPYLPKFLSPPRRVKINGESIIYIEMELLKHLNKRMERIANDLVDHLDLPWSELGTMPPGHKFLVSDETKTMLQGPKENKRMWYNFYQTLTELFKYYGKRSPEGEKKKSTAVMWDIGGSNIMSRNSVPVITDPFIAY